MRIKVSDAIREFRGEFAFLSNFYPHKFTWNGDEWQTAEHAFQAAKAEETLDYFKIRDAVTPRMAKWYGRRCPIRDDWAKDRVNVMKRIIRAKFSVPELGEKLVSTGDRKLVEGNRWGDKYWGVDIETGKGENHLGRVLMMIRDELLVLEHEEVQDRGL